MQAALHQAPDTPYLPFVGSADHNLENEPAQQDRSGRAKRSTTCNHQRLRAQWHGAPNDEVSTNYLSAAWLITFVRVFKTSSADGLRFAQSEVISRRRVFCHSGSFSKWM